MRPVASRLLAFGVLSAASLVAVSPVHAQQTAVERARTAFERGMAAESDGRGDEACAAFRESLGLVRELGPLRKVAACDEREGRLGKAAESLEEVLRSLPSEDPERAATEEILGRVRARMARLILSVRPGAAAGMKARVEGKEVAVPATDVLLDPGTHDVVVDVPGGDTRVVRLTIAAGETATVVLPPASDDVRVMPPPPPLAPRVAAPPPPAPRSAAMRTTGLVVSGVGLAGLAVAAITGLKLLGDQSTFDECEVDPTCTQSADLARDADSLLVVNAVAWGVGVTGAAVGATLLVVDASTRSSDDAAGSAPPRPTLRAQLGVGRASLAGSF